MTGLAMVSLILFSSQALGESPIASDSARRKAVDRLFVELTAAGSPGAAVGIYQAGRPIYSQGYGRADLEHVVPITPQTVFHAGSVSKQFTAFAIVLLAREGKLDLDADIRSYLPYLPDFGHAITARHLLLHTSGLRDYLMLFWLGGHSKEDLIGQQHVVNMMSRQRALNFQPGTRFLYCNTGYALLAEIVRAVSGKTLRQFTHERIFRPLGMTNTFFYDDVTEIVSGRAYSYQKRNGTAPWRRATLNSESVGSTGLNTTVEDLMKWSANFANPVVGDAGLLEQIAAPGALHDGSALKYGFGLRRATFAGHEALTHTGHDAGFAALFTYFPKHDFSIVILMNQPGDLATRATAIARLYLGDSVERSRPAGEAPVARRPSRALLRAAAGSYLNPIGHLVSLVRDGDRLTWKRIEGDAVPIAIHSDGRFELHDGERVWGRFRLLRSGDGPVTSIEEIDDVNPPVVYPRAARANPSAASLTELAGDYRSFELQHTYTLSVESGRLTARSLWSAEPIHFTPSTTDRFDAPSWVMHTIVFERDSHGKPMAFRAHAARGAVRDVRFERE